MLINFRTKNFLSYKEMTEFSMVAGSTKLKSDRLEKKDKFSLLKFSAIYGANASGKSNIINAMKVMKWMLVKGLPEVSLDINFKLCDECKKLPTYFEVDLSLENHNYSYGFEYYAKENKITSEWLIDLDDNEKIVFERDVVKGYFRFEVELPENLKNKFLVYIDDLKEDGDKLFLSFVYEKRKLFDNVNLAPMLNIANWFYKKVFITEPSAPLTSLDYYLTDDKINEIASILKVFDTGIKSVKRVEVPIEEAEMKIPSKIIEDVKKKFENKPLQKFSLMLRKGNEIWIIEHEEEYKYYKIYFYHEDVPFDPDEESDGTLRLLDLAEVLLTNERDKVYVIDELDRCLHPQVTCQFVKIFLELAKIRNVQLIVTTHESRLLDFEVLRRDEIWFTNKKDGATELYSLEEFNERFDKKIDKAYLDGRYGGIPIFDTIFPTVLNASSVKD